MDIPRSIVSRYATAWAENLEGAFNGHQFWAILCRYRCRLLLAEVPDGSDRNTQLKQLLQLLEAGEVHDLVGRILGQQHTGQQTREKKTVQRQTEEQRGKRACARTARGSIGRATTGLVGGAATGSAECRKHWTTALVPRAKVHIPPTRSKLKRHKQLGAEADTRQPAAL